MTRRTTSTEIVSVTAGCHVCGGGNVQWRGKNAQALAARHHDKTHHRTFAEQLMRIEYGGSAAKRAQQGRLL